MASEKHKYDWLFDFLEKDLIRVVLFIAILFLISNHISYTFEFEYYFESIESFVQNEIRIALSDLKSSLLSIAAIFIGIYITVFTLLGSIRVDSIFAFLNEKTFEKLIKYIRNAFIAAFLYLILIISLEISFDIYLDIPYYLVVFNVGIVLYMFLTALRFGIILYTSFRSDLSNIHKNIEKHREEHKDLKNLQIRIEKFLDRDEEEHDRQQAKKISEISRDNEEK